LHQANNSATITVQVYVQKQGETMTIVNPTTARKEFFKLIDETIDSHEPIIIAGKRGNVVMISEEDYRSIQETIYLTSIPGMRERLLEGRDTPLEDCVEDED
jgi:antitoxin YefM